ncbi:hypothetical protein ATJ97_3138 [Georgenia soli]|uniref:Uncharacterized protein n=1 Tax=Georgenia soli TaxID=638953 RepID=A0A2A9ENE1_9MICO|nr:hypothetical protein [Georgenia soli]PFG40607.1 hypothetical protein ATJ97_3138 [Georgenia soli]
MTENTIVPTAYADAARLIIGLINDTEDADQALQRVAVNASRTELIHLAFAALHTAAEMVSAEAAASVLAGEEGVPGPALEALTDSYSRALKRLRGEPDAPGDTGEAS